MNPEHCTGLASIELICEGVTAALSTRQPSAAWRGCAIPRRGARAHIRLRRAQRVEASLKIVSL
jgi:hypothetical protein